MKEIAISQGFSLNRETIKILNEFKKKYKIPKSTILRILIKYFQNHLDELDEILKNTSD